MTKVVNIYREKYDVYIGRAGKGQSGYFGNPHPVGFCKICNCIHARDEAIAEYKKDFDKRMESDLEFKNKVLELKDKTLGCFCKPNNACHGDVIAEYLNGESI